MRTHELTTSSLDVTELRREVLENISSFDEYALRRTFPNSPHAGMTDIWARFNDIRPFLEKGSMQGFDMEHDSIWYPIVDKIPAIKKVLFDIMSIVQGERLGGVLLTKVPPGGRVLKHTDSGWHAKYYDKFYVPILNEKGALFCFEDGNIDPEYGQAWWFDNSNPHWVENTSKSDRIAMIVCIRTEMYKDKNAQRI